MAAIVQGKGKIECVEKIVVFLYFLYNIYIIILSGNIIS
jgi:hypothetical protein